MTFTRTLSLHLLIVLVCVAAVFGASIGFDFVWDDRVLLVGSDVYASFDLKRILFSLANQVEYLPVRDLSYALDHALWGENPFGFHLGNLVLYFLNCAFVYLLTLRLTPLLFAAERAMPAARAGEIALFTALLFAVHPVHSEAVSWITGRNGLLAGLFFFACCWFFLKALDEAAANRKTAFAASLLCCALAIFSKATAVTLPGVLALLALLHGASWRRSLPLLVPFVAVSAAAVIFFEAVATQTGLINPDQLVSFGSRSLGARLAVAAQIPFFYLGKLAWPTGLTALYGVKFAKDLGDPRVWLCGLGLGAAIVLGIRLRVRFPALLFALGWYLIALLPVLNLLATPTVVADRYVYLASYAFIYLAVAVLHLGRWRLPATATRSIAAVAVIVLSFMAFERNGAWRTDETLWKAAIRVSPEVGRPYYNLAVYYFSRQEYAPAFELLEQLAELRQSDGTLRLYKAQYAFNQGDYRTAIELLEGVSYGEESPFQVPYLLGQAYEASGNIPKAIDHYAETLQKGSHAGVEALVVARGRLEKLQARISPQFDEQRRAVRENPADLNGRAQLAVALDQAGFYEEALGHYRELSRRGGDNWSLFYNLGNVYRKLGMNAEAAESYEKSIALNPGHPQTYNNLGVSLKKLHEDERAIRAFEAAMELDPGFENAPFNLATLYFRLGDRENATRVFDRVVRSFPELQGQVNPYLKALE